MSQRLRDLANQRREVLKVHVDIQERYRSLVQETVSEQAMKNYNDRLRARVIELEAHEKQLSLALNQCNRFLKNVQIRVEPWHETELRQLFDRIKQCLL